MAMIGKTGKHSLKSFIAILSCLVFCLTAIAGSAERATTTDENGLVYDASGYFASYGKTVVGYTGTGTTIDIPPDVGAVILQDVFDYSGVEVISLKQIKSSVEVDLYGSYPSLKQIIPPDDPDSPYYVEQGMLISKPHYLKVYKQFSYSTILVKCPGTLQGAIAIPDGVTYIGADSFLNCTGITSVSLPDSVRTISSGVFQGCTALTSVTGTESLTSIGEDAFRSCSNLSTFEIPDTVTSIGSGAFAYCTSLKSLKLSANITSIGNSAFSGDEALTVDVEPGSFALKYAAQNGLHYTINGQEPTEDFIKESQGFEYYVRDDGNATITGCSLTGDIVIPQTLDGHTVDNLESKLFYGKYDITSIFLPATLTFFGENREDNDWDYEFSYCSDLKEIRVDPNNPTFCSEDGVLFTKEKGHLICYPVNKKGLVYHVNDPTRMICCTAFASNKYLKRLYLDNKEIYWQGETFYDTGEMTVYYLPGGESERRVGIHSQKCHEVNPSYPTYSPFNPDESQEIPQIVAITEAAFPDAVFRQYVLETLDADGDGWLNELEVEVAQLDVSSCGIRSLQGIGYLKGLTSLDCSYNQLTALDLRDCPALTSLTCMGNQITALDISPCEALTNLVIHAERKKKYTLDSFSQRVAYNEWRGEDAETLLRVNENVTVQAGNVIITPSPTSTPIPTPEPTPEPTATPKPTPQGIAIDKTNFPDAGLREVVREDADRNDDGFLSDQEIQWTTILYCDDIGISSVKGIEFLTALKIFSCRNNQLTTLDVSKLTHLEQLNAYGNPELTVILSSSSPVGKLVDKGTRCDGWASYNDEEHVNTSSWYATDSGFADLTTDRTSTVKTDKKTSWPTEATVTVKDGKYSLKNGSVTFIGPKNKKLTKLVIQDQVKINGKKYKVTAIAENACKDMKKLTAVTIGKNVKTIGKNAFRSCTKLKNITIKTEKLTSNAVGENAFKGINAKAAIKCPAKKLKQYKTLLLKKGMKKTMTFSK